MKIKVLETETNKRGNEGPRPNQLLPNQKPLTPLMYIGMVGFGTIEPTSLMTAHVKGHYKNRKKICEIKTGNGMITCGMRTKQRPHKANKDNMTNIKVHSSINR